MRLSRNQYLSIYPPPHKKNHKKKKKSMIPLYGIIRFSLYFLESSTLIRRLLRMSKEQFRGLTK